MSFSTAGGTRLIGIVLMIQLVDRGPVAFELFSFDFGLDRWIVDNRWIVVNRSDAKLFVQELEQFCYVWYFLIGTRISQPGLLESLVEFSCDN